jgi:hypothetical protein
MKNDEPENLSTIKEFMDEMVNILGTFAIIGNYWYNIFLPEEFDDEQVKRTYELIKKYFS